MAKDIEGNLDWLVVLPNNRPTELLNEGMTQGVDKNLAYDNAMADFTAQQKLNNLYKEKLSYDPNDITFGDKVDALLHTSNIAYAYYNRQDVEVSDEIMKTYQDREFNTKEVNKAIVDTDMFGFDKYIDDNPAESWEDFEKKKTFFKEHTRKLQIISNEVPLYFSIPASVIAGIVDIDTVALALTGSAVGLTAKGGKIIDKVADLYKNAGYTKRVAMGAGAGTFYSGLNEALYQKATGVYSSDDFKTALIGGAVLGGGITGILNIDKLVRTSTNNNTNLRQDLEMTENKIVDMKSALKDATEHRDNYLQAVELAKISKTNSDLVDNIRFNEANKLHRAEIETVNTTKPKVADIRKEFTEQNKTVLDRAKATIKTLTDNAKTKFNELEKLRKDLPIREEKILKKIKDLETKLNSKQEDIKTKSSQGKKTEGLTKQLNKLKEDVSKAKDELKQLNKQKTSIAKQAGITKADDVLTKKELTELNKAKETLAKFDEDLNKVVTERKTNYETKIKELKGLTKEQIIDKFKDDKRIVGLTSRYSGMSKDDIVKDILQNTENYTQWSARLQDGSFTVDDYIIAGATKKGFVDKLAEELRVTQAKMEDMKEAVKILENEIAINPILKKMLWTPIARLQTSDNPFVRALATKMSTGTIHTNSYSGKTALRVKQNLDELSKNMMINIQNDYKKAVKEGLFKGSIDDYHSEIGRLKGLANDELDARAFSMTDPSLSYAKAREKAREIKDTLEYNLSNITDNKYLIQSINRVNKYYEDMHSMGRTYKIDGFEGSSKRGYLNRTVDLNKLAKLDPSKAKEDVLNAQIKYLNERGVTVSVDSELFRTLQIKSDELIENALNKKNNIERVISKVSEGKLGNKEVTYERTIDVNASDLEHILNTDINFLVNMYGRQVHGNFALKDVYGIYKRTEFEELMEKNKFSAKEKDLFIVAVEDIKGIREMLRDPDSLGQLSLGLTSRLANLSYVGNFGMTSMGEIFVAMDRYGAFNTMKNILPSVKDTYRLWKDSSVDEKNILLAMTNKHTPRASTNMLSVENSMVLDNTNRVFKGLDYMADKLAKIGLLQPVTDFTRILSSSSAQSWLANVAHNNSLGKRLSNADKVRLGKFGFTEEDLPAIRKEMGLDDKGLVTNEHLEHSTLGNRILDGIQDSVDATVMSGSAMHLPTFMTDRGVNNWLSVLAFKFMRYPMEAYEKLLLRGIQEADARKIVMVGLNSMAFSLMFMLRDAMKSDEQKKRYEGDDGFALLMRDSIAMNSYLGVIPSAVDFGWSTLTGENLTNDYKSRSLSDSIYGKYYEGKFGFNLLGGRIEYDAVDNQLQIFKLIYDLGEANKE